MSMYSKFHLPNTTILLKQHQNITKSTCKVFAPLKIRDLVVPRAPKGTLGKIPECSQSHSFYNHNSQSAQEIFSLAFPLSRKTLAVINSHNKSNFKDLIANANDSREGK